MKDSTSNRIGEIEVRINWLQMEIVHKNYWPGGIVNGFREELSRLVNELEVLTKK